MIVEHSQTANKGEFFIKVDDKKVALMTYSMAGTGKIIIDHTEVDESFKGQGLGYKLVEASVDHARADNINILPLCPFAKAVFNKRPEYQDVLF